MKYATIIMSSYRSIAFSCCPSVLVLCDIPCAFVLGSLGAQMGLTLQMYITIMMFSSIRTDQRVQTTHPAAPLCPEHLRMREF